MFIIRTDGPNDFISSSMQSLNIQVYVLEYVNHGTMHILSSKLVAEIIAPALCAAKGNRDFPNC